MIVPAKRVYLSEAEIDSLVKGDEVNIDSGMGGSYTMIIRDALPGVFLLKCEMKDHEHRRSIARDAAPHEFFRLEVDYDSPAW